MQLQALKYFLDACRLQSMTAAALLNHVSRPAISQAIKKLEGDLNTPLLHHKKRGFDLTAAGQRVSQSASHVFDSVELLKTVALGKSQSEMTGSLRIGVARVLSTYRFDDALASLKQDHPKVQLRLRLHNSELLLDQLESRDLDIAVIISDETRAGLTAEVLEEGSFVLLRPKSFLHGSVTYALSERRPETDSLRRLFKAKYQRDLPIFAEVPSWDAIWNWIQRGHCGGLIPDLFLRRTGSKTITFSHVLKDVYPYKACVYYRDNQSQHPLLRSMIERLRASF